MQERSDVGTGARGQHSGIARLQSETEARLGVLAAGLREYAILVLDAAGRVQRWDAAAEHILGYRGEEIIGEHISVFSPPEQAAAVRPDWQLAEATEFGNHVDEGWCRRRDGTGFWAHVVTTAQHAADGAAVGFLQVLRDETEAGVHQQRSSRRFSDLFDLTPAGIALFDETGHVLDANEALSNLLGYRIQDLNHMPAISLMHPNDRDAGLIADEAASARLNQPRVRQRLLLSSDGHPVPCEVLSTSSVADDGSRFWLVVFQDITEWQRQTDELRHQATHDELTGLLNRTGLNELLDSVLHGGAERVAVLFCDLDNFKRVNDALGHEAGDELLTALARRLTDGLPPGCVPARLSGDEYLIICSDVDTVGGLESFTTWVAELLRTTVPLRGQLIAVSASVGAAMLDQDTAGGNLLRYADTAMFHAKSKGPGRISLASRALIGVREGQLDLEEQLREALETDSLELHYQPILDRDGAVVMAEALVRWPHPDRGLLSPAVILPVAEQGDLLRALDRWVLRTALAEATTWPEQSGHPVSVAINLVDLLPHDPEFIDAVTAAITETGVDPSRVVLEMVETSLVELPTRPHQAMVELVERGVRFALDDFGTGYSSLARLKDLPTQILKLDRQFVTGVETDPADVAIAQAMIGMGHAMGRNCVAEGVETPGQFHALDNLGIELYQGWLFSHALPLPEFRTYLTPRQA
ncbi:diguanylate cyclase (GGDEF)-like protein/PAS domain S-box-containing protein [Saccharopolyspora lacisalsi]|uniref:Diguanylate cyclase (GGDEF)-like protein/PAS domain S-box-containing protein n=1 Tax=Halosaccharopolyspora lacisalsi TaxID=1000566 RepID=A0A839DWW0_9PSEU|nr:bifunctional diguanylate cyclase/phosphodiesterase [Halosaccharopolyspora lacisalsi]MBA8824716.1 diguanylate cyclase (GGDEF)-like protein/PAS domain S-box-containing protein [Halosaccharopolyspora lacisalsi]